MSNLIPIKIPKLISSEAQQAGIDALSLFFYSDLIAIAPFFGLPIIKWFTKYAMDKLVNKWADEGRIVLNDQIIEDDVNADLKKVISIWDTVNTIGTGLTQKEIEDLENEQIKASNNFLIIGRKRL